MPELHEAAIKRDIRKIRKLLQQGHNPNELDSRGWAPLHHIVIRFLLFNVSIKQDAHAKRINEFSEIVSFPKSVLGETITIIDLLLTAKADINLKTNDENQQTALHFAAYNNHFKLTKYLLSKDADVRACNSKRATPLHLAVSQQVFTLEKKKMIATVKLLLKYNADPNTVDEVGHTSITLAKILKIEQLDVILQPKVLPNKTTSSPNNFPILFKRQVDSLKTLAAKSAISARYNLSKSSKLQYYKKLLLLPPKLYQEYPKLESDHKKLFIHKVNEIITSFFQKIPLGFVVRPTDLVELKKALEEQKESPEENPWIQNIVVHSGIFHIINLNDALQEQEPYSVINNIMQELAQELKKISSETFKKNMQPIYDQIMQVTKEYNEDKEFSEQCASQLKK